MSPFLQRLAGIMLVIASLIGLVVNIAALLFILPLEQQIVRGTEETLEILDHTLSTTSAGLTIVDISLDNAAVTMGSVETTTRSMGRTISDTIPLIDTVATLTGEELPASIKATQRSLDAAGVGAQAIDRVLMSLNTLAFLQGGTAYSPPQPLHQSLANVSDSLDPLPSSFIEMQESLVLAGSNLTEVQGEVHTLANNLGQIDDTIRQAQLVNNDYRDVAKQLQGVIDNLRANVATWLRWVSIAIGVLLVWLIVAQIGLLSQGIEMIGRSRKQLTN